MAPNISQMDEEEQQFAMTRGNDQLRRPHPSQHILTACSTLEKELVKEEMKRVAEDLLGTCETEYWQEEKKGLVFPLFLRKNQEEELGEFLDTLHVMLEAKGVETFKTEKRLMSIQMLGVSEVREIVLQIYMFMEENPELYVGVFICQSITDLSEQNIYLFEKGLRGKGFVVIAPTCETFDGDMEYNTNSYIKFHQSLYNPKDLFCKYMYQSVAREDIRAYLPQEVLTLISDMDAYSISFRENCRRFVYCLERSLQLVKRERTWCNFEPLLSTIDDIICRKFKHYFGYRPNIEKKLKVILSEKEEFTIHEGSLVFEMTQRHHAGDHIDEDTWIKSVRDSLFKHLGQRPDYQQFTRCLTETEEVPAPKQRSKRSRSDQLGIDTKKNITPKKRLEIQITKIIKMATQAIRTLASSVSWADIKFQLRIRPQIPYLLVESLKNEPETKELVREITRHHTAPLAQYLSMFGSEDLGQAIYLLKRLELQGLIDISKKHIKPVVTLNFFDKASFSGKH